MSRPPQATVDVQGCGKEIPLHPCEEQPPCDPFKRAKGGCAEPYICIEKIKNPAIPGEIMKCLSSATMNAKSCAKVPAPHPCEAAPPCQQETPRDCSDPHLCAERVRYPGRKPTPCELESSSQT